MLNGYPISAKLPEDLGIGERFWYWRGASGQSYIHSIYPADACPPLPGAVFLAVKRHRDGEREVLAVDRFPSVLERSGDVRHLGASEIHVHLLARSSLLAEAVRDDLLQALTSDRFPASFQEDNAACMSIM